MITKISENKKRLAIYLDDQFVCFLNAFTIYKHKLAVGQEITKEKLEEIQFESEMDSAFDQAIKYISKYQKTESELVDYLQKKGYMPSLCQAVLKKVKEYRYIDDKNFVEAYVKQNRGRVGINKIKQSLKQKGISDELISQIEIEEDISDLQKIALKYLKNKEKNSANMQKCMKFMFSRGFSYDDISKTINSIKGESYEDWQ